MSPDTLSFSSERPTRGDTYGLTYAVTTALDSGGRAAAHVQCLPLRFGSDVPLSSLYDRSWLAGRQVAPHPRVLLSDATGTVALKDGQIRDSPHKSALSLYYDSDHVVGRCDV